MDVIIHFPIILNLKNIIYNIISNLEFKERYYFGITSQSIFEEYFCTFHHPEIFKITKSGHKKRTLKCYRCGRRGHIKYNCYTSKHIKGYYL